MPTLLDEPPPRPATRSAPAERLRTTMAAMRLSFTWFGVRKTLTTEQKAQAAESFGAEGEFLSAGKKLLDTRHEKFKAVTTVRNRAVQFWKSMSLPFPEAGIRLIKQSDLEKIDGQMSELKGELTEAVAELDRHYESLRSAARSRLGGLYNHADYPASLRGLFDVTWDFPSVEPPPYLQQLSPELYRQECERMRVRFEESIQLAEQAFLEELSRLVEHLTERLTGESDCKPKVFRDSAVTNMDEFFERFRHLNIRSNEQLDELVQRAQQVVRGVEPQQLRDSQPLRQRLASQLSSVQSALDGLLVDRPRRNILRRASDAMVLELLIDPGGQVRCLYDEAFDLTSLGKLEITRGSHVEPTADGRWTADLAPVDGPVLGPFSLRSQALEAERRWLLEHWLTPRT